MRIPYGLGSQLSLPAEWDPKIVRFPSTAPGMIVEDAQGEVRRSLAEPIDYPSLGRCLAPGDKVAFVVDREIPLADEIVAAAIEVAISSGVRTDDLAVVVESDSDLPLRISQRLPKGTLGAVLIERHHPNNERSLRYVANTREAHPLYVNRILAEADFVVPILAIRPKRQWVDFGPFTGIFPVFGNQDWQSRAIDLLRTKKLRHKTPQPRSSIRSHMKTAHSRMRRWNEEARWLLGLEFAVFVVTAPESKALGIFSGQWKKAYEAATALSSRLWSIAIERPFSAAIATVVGTNSQDPMLVNRALLNVATVTSAGAKIVLCAALTETPTFWSPRSDPHARSNSFHSAPWLESRTRRLLHDRKVFVLGLSESESHKLRDVIPLGDEQEAIRVLSGAKEVLVLQDADQAWVRKTNSG